MSLIRMIMLGFSGTLVLLIGLWNARALMLLIRRRMIVVQRSMSPQRIIGGICA